MKNFFTKLFLDPIFSSLVTIVAGILITIFYSQAIDIICRLIGCAAILLGLFDIIKYFRAPVEFKINLLTGLILGALGISIALNPTGLQNFVAVVIGIIVLYHGIVNFQSSLAIKKTGYKFWYISLIFALLTLVAGILLIALKHLFGNALATVIGVTLIVEGVLNTWTTIKVKSSND